MSVATSTHGSPKAKEYEKFALGRTCTDSEPVALRKAARAAPQNQTRRATFSLVRFMPNMRTTHDH